VIVGVHALGMLVRRDHTFPIDMLFWHRVSLPEIGRKSGDFLLQILLGALVESFLAGG
jgi:hypothetical protein